MSSKMPARLDSICKVLLLPCIVGIVLLSTSELERRFVNRQFDTIDCVNQTIWDLTLFQNKNIRFRNVSSARNTVTDYGIVESPYLFTIPFSSTIVRFKIELFNPQSLAVFNPTTRSPPF